MSSAAAPAPDDVAGAPRPRGNNKRGAKTRAELIDAAAACFSEYGYTQTRISDIVHRAGVSQGNFYRHFTSKREVFLEALQPSLDALRAASSRGPALHDQHDVATLVAITDAFFVAYSRHRHLLRVMREAAAVGGDDSFAELWLHTRGAFVTRTLGWLERLHAAGKIGPGNLPMLAEALGCMIEQVAYVNIGFPPQAPRPETMHQLAQTVGEVWFRALPPRV